MRKARKEPGEDFVDFSYEGRPVAPDLLDYRHMQVSMSKWADTGRIGCWGTVTLTITLFAMCLLGLLVYRFLFMNL
jgi:hypothetical protein